MAERREAGTGTGDPSENAIRSAFELALEYVQREGRLPPSLDPDPEQACAQLGLALGNEGLPLEQVIERLRRVLLATPSSASPRFVNQLFGGRDPVATLAEMLTPLSNTSMYTYKAAGPQVHVEREVISRMCARVGYPDGEGMFAPGGSLANLTALVVARNETVEGAREHGVAGDLLTVYTSAEGHYSIRKSAGMLGLGRRNVRDVPTDSAGRMDVAELRRVLARDVGRGYTPVMINATAGTTVLGAFDPIREIAEVARRHDVWLHVDGALGGSVLLCEGRRHLLDGSDLADSFSWNAHKMMGVPLSCSVLLLRERGALSRNLEESAGYLFQTGDDELNPGLRSVQCGRRNDALKVWAAWLHHGDRGYDARIERMFRLAEHATRIIEADPRLRLAKPPQSINVCFEVRDRSSAEICDRLDRDGVLKIGYGNVDGRSVIRLVCVNPSLDEADLDAIFHEIKAAAAALDP